MSEIGKLRIGIKNNRWGKKHSEETKNKMSESARGRKHSIETRQKMSIAFTGRKLSNETRQKLSKAHMGISSKHTPEQDRKQSELMKTKIGSLAPNWKGGVTPLNRLLRASSSYKEWRKSVFERDNWICQDCKTRGGRLEAHHIKPFSRYIELRFDVSNGVTLCASCHSKTDTYRRVSGSLPELV